MPFSHQGWLEQEHARRAYLTPEQRQWEDQMGKIRKIQRGRESLLGRWRRRLYWTLSAFIASSFTGAVLRQSDWIWWSSICIFISAGVFLILSGTLVWRMVVVSRDLKVVHSAIDMMETFKQERGWGTSVTSYPMR